MREEPQPSARVQLEVAFLADADSSSPALPTHAAPPGLAVLIVAAEADVRRYVGECLRTRANLRLYEASNTSVAAELAEKTPLDFAIADRSDGLEGLSHLRTIVIVDEVPYGAAATTRMRLLGRPFSAEQLAKEVDQLLLREEST